MCPPRSSLCCDPTYFAKLAQLCTPVIGSLLIAVLSAAVVTSVAVAWGLGLHTLQHSQQSSCSVHPALTHVLSQL